MINLDLIKPRVTEIAEKHGLDLVVLFGSQATGRTHAKSDMDIAVLGGGKQKSDTYANIDNATPVDRARLGVEFDNALKRNDVEVIDLAKASPTLMYMIVKEGVLLYERRHTDFLWWKVRVMREWMETAWLRELGKKKLIEWAQQL